MDSPLSDSNTFSAETFVTSMLSLSSAYLPGFRARDTAVFFTSMLFWHLYSEMLKFTLSHFSFWPRLTRKVQVDLYSRIVGLTFSAFIVIGAGRVFLFQSEYRTQPLQHLENAAFLCAFAAGYFAWDIILCLRHFSIFGMQFLLHAVFCFLVYFFCVGDFLQYHSCVFLMYEASTPWLNLLWISTKLGLFEHPLLTNICGGLLIVSFFFFRLVLGPYYLIDVFSVLWFDDVRLQIDMFRRVYYAAAAAVLTILNIIWFRLIIAFARRQVKAGKAPKQA